MTEIGRSAYERLLDDSEIRKAGLTQVRSSIVGLLGGSDLAEEGEKWVRGDIEVRIPGTKGSYKRSGNPGERNPLRAGGQRKESSKGG